MTMQVSSAATEALADPHHPRVPASIPPSLNKSPSPQACRLVAKALEGQTLGGGGYLSTSSSREP